MPLSHTPHQPNHLLLEHQRHPPLPPPPNPKNNILPHHPPSLKTTPSLPSLRACLRRWKWPHILLLQEVKIAPHDTKTQSLIRRLINTPIDSSDSANEANRLYDAHFSLPRDKYNATASNGKIYGVCTLLRRDIIHPHTTTLPVPWDSEGRVLLTKLPDYNLIIHNIYAVNGTTNPYRCPTTGVVIGTRHDFKRIFHTHLANSVQHYTADENWSVILAGDLNIARTPIDSYPSLRMGAVHVANRADFEEKIIKGAEMVDIWRKRWGKGEEGRKFTYRPRRKGREWGSGGDRVDMVLVGRGVEGRVRACDILDREEERGGSDHVPLWVEVEVGGGLEGGGES